MIQGGPGGWMLQPTTSHINGRIFDPLVVNRVWGYLRPHRFRLLWAMALVTVTAAMQLAGPYLLKIAIDEYLVSRHDMLGLSFIACAFALTLVISWASQSHQSYTMALITQDVLNKIRSELFEKINRLSLSYHDRHESGVTMSRIVNDVAVFQELLTQGVIHLLADCLTLIGIVYVMWTMDPRLALYAFSVLPIMVIATAIYTSKARNAFLRT